MQAWEYGVDTINTREGVCRLTELFTTNSGLLISSVLDEWGEKGWELVSFLPAMPSTGANGEKADPWMFHAVFKRPFPVV